MRLLMAHAVLAVVVCQFLAGVGNAAVSGLADTESVLEKWVQTRELISRAKGQWQNDRETLEQTTKLLQRDLEAVQAQMTGLGTNSAQVTAEKRQAEEQLKASNESLERMRRFAAEFEGHVRSLLPSLPAPLQEILQPLLARMPADPANTKMTAGERMQILVGVLNELDKFNNAVTVFNEKRKGPKDEEIAVESVYLGLGAAYFVNASGDFAGSGRPGAGGWEWTMDSSLAANVREVIRIYRNERPARFVGLPAAIR